MRELEMTMAEPALKYPTDPAAFLDWEQRQTERYELVGGVVRMMVGAAIGHNMVADNIHVALANRLHGKPCRAWRGDTRVAAPGGQLMYPDVLVSCTPRRPDELVVDDPVLIVEVLSPSTAHYDQTAKRWAYQAIEAVRQIVYAAPDEVKVEIVTREADGSWRSVFATESGGELPLSCLELDLPMAEIYADIAFDRIAAEAG
jgi:Uma2 family endonuclease